MVRKYCRLIQKFLYICTGILKVCENAKISHRRLQKVELGYQNAKKLKFYHLRYPDSHKDPARLGLLRVFEGKNRVYVHWHLNPESLREC